MLARTSVTAVHGSMCNVRQWHCHAWNAVLKVPASSYVWGGVSLTIHAAHIHRHAYSWSINALWVPVSKHKVLQLLKISSFSKALIPCLSGGHINTQEQGLTCTACSSADWPRLADKGRCTFRLSLWTSLHSSRARTATALKTEMTKDRDPWMVKAQQNLQEQHATGDTRKCMWCVKLSCVVFPVHAPDVTAQNKTQSR